MELAYRIFSFFGRKRRMCSFHKTSELIKHEYFIPKIGGAKVEIFCDKSNRQLLIPFCPKGYFSLK